MGIEKGENIVSKMENNKQDVSPDDIVKVQKDIENIHNRLKKLEEKDKQEEGDPEDLLLGLNALAESKENTLEVNNKRSKKKELEDSSVEEKNSQENKKASGELVKNVKEKISAASVAVINFIKRIFNFFSRLFGGRNMFDIGGETENIDKIPGNKTKEGVYFEYNGKHYGFGNDMNERKTMKIPKGGTTEEKKLSSLKDIPGKKRITAGNETFQLENGKVMKVLNAVEAKKDKTATGKELDNGNIEFEHEGRTFQLDSQGMPIVPPEGSNLSNITILQGNILVNVGKEKYVVYVQGGEVSGWKWFDHGKYIKNLSHTLFNKEKSNNINNQSFEKPSNAIYSIETGDISHRIRQTFEILDTIRKVKETGVKIYFPKDIHTHIHALKEYGIIDNSIDMDTTTKVEENIEKIKDQIYTYIMSGKFFT